MVTKLGTISVFFVLFFIPTSVFAVQTPIIFDVTCTMTDYEPYYDCRQPLFIVVFDQRHPPDWNWWNDTWSEQNPDEGEKYSLGTAYWNQFIIYNGTITKKFNMIVLGYTHGEKGAGQSYDGEELTPLVHEIKHIKCKCRWHDGGD